MIDEVTVERYTHGECHVLAQALHELTGWRAGVLLDEPEGVGHMFLIVTPQPAGMPADVIDVRGVRSFPAMQAAWNGHSFYDEADDPAELCDIHGWPDPESYDMSAARAAAREVLRDAG